MIAWDRVAELREEIGEDSFAEVIEMFVEEAEELSDAIAEAGPDQMEGAMHAMKSTALNLGLSELAEICAVGELAAAAGRSDEVDVAGVLLCYRRARKALLERVKAANAA